MRGSANLKGGQKTTPMWHPPTPSSPSALARVGLIVTKMSASPQGVVHFYESERVIKTTMKPVAQEFLHQQPIAFVATIDADGWVWASLVAGLPGFMVAVDEGTIHIGAAPTVSDPLHDNLRVNADVGLLIMNFATHRRMRVNGRAELQPDGSFDVHAQQVYANCPKYIQARRFEVITPAGYRTHPMSLGPIG